MTQTLIQTSNKMQGLLSDECYVTPLQTYLRYRILCI